MAGSKTHYLQAKILDLILGQTAWTPPTDLYVALSKDAFDPAATGTTLGATNGEVTAPSYARIHITNDATNFDPSADLGSAQWGKYNKVTWTFPTAAEDWGTVASVYLCDAATLGNALLGVDLNTPVDITSGSTPDLPANTFGFIEY